MSVGTEIMEMLMNFKMIAKLFRYAKIFVCSGIDKLLLNSRVTIYCGYIVPLGVRIRMQSIFYRVLSSKTPFETKCRCLLLKHKFDLNNRFTLIRIHICRHTVLVLLLQHEILFKPTIYIFCHQIGSVILTGKYNKEYRLHVARQFCML